MTDDFKEARSAAITDGVIAIRKCFEGGGPRPVVDVVGEILDAFLSKLRTTHAVVPREPLVKALAHALAQQGHSISADSMVPMKSTEPWGDSPGDWPMWKEWVPAAESIIDGLKQDGVDDLRKRRDDAATAVTDWMNAEDISTSLRFNYQAPGWMEYEAAEKALAAALSDSPAVQDQK